ncbi:hypothetical protein RCL_jg6029.t1 [Rhizophagus clarus]|uniref:Uncharacterized protein n=1 Tax=Rhizophagus clarus TaxID=94130 RepID=A0A8H3L2Y7_9GLOM|nr:hypothetical protein RCL_jg6029.t1 [Rhizophagus clarus]
MVFQRSGIPLKTDRYFKGPEVLYRQITIWKKWTELFQRPGTLIRSGPRSAVCSFLKRYETLKVYDFWTSFWTRFQRLTTLSKLSFLTKMLTLLWFCGFEGPEPFLRQTSYLKAHGFPNTNKRWGRIKVRGSKRKVEK